MAQDISLTLTFDYSKDTAFSPLPPIPVVKEIDPLDEKLFFKECGWFSAWGKELTGVDTSKIGGMALEGEWLFARKHVSWSAHPHGHTPVPHEIVVHMDSLKIGKSPIIASVSIDGVRIAVAVTKVPDDPTICRVAKYTMLNASIPFPANAEWTSHVNYQKGKSVSGLAPTKNLVDVTIKCEVEPGFEVNFAAMETNSHCAVFSSNLQNPLLDGLAIARNPYTVIADAYDNGAKKGLIQFDTYNPPLRSTQRKSSYAKSNKQPELSGIPKPLAFTPPAGLEVPVLPAGCNWGLNVRGIILLIKNGQFLHPYEVWDLIQMEQDLASFDREIALGGRDVENLKYMREQLDDQTKQVRALFEYCESVGNGIALNYKVFKDYAP